MVDLPTFTIKNQPNVGKKYMDGMGNAPWPNCWGSLFFVPFPYIIPNKNKSRSALCFVKSLAQHHILNQKKIAYTVQLIQINCRIFCSQWLCKLHLPHLQYVPLRYQGYFAFPTLNSPRVFSAWKLAKPTKMDGIWLILITFCSYHNFTSSN